MKPKAKIKGVKHIWKYLTSPTYRFWVNFCTQEEMVNKSLEDIQKHLWLQIHPLFMVDEDFLLTVKDGLITPLPRRGKK